MLTGTELCHHSADRDPSPQDFWAPLLQAPVCSCQSGSLGEWSHVVWALGAVLAACALPALSDVSSLRECPRVPSSLM